MALSTSGRVGLPRLYRQGHGNQITATGSTSRGPIRELHAIDHKRAEPGQHEQSDNNEAEIGETIEHAIRANAGLVAQAMMAAPGEAVEE